MSATDQMRAMLDELMGTNRDGGVSCVTFDDPQVCKCFLLGCCPHDILSGTRLTMGECRKIHDFALKADYKAASKRRDCFVEFDALRQLEAFIADCDRRTEEAKRKLREDQEELPPDALEKTESIHKLGEEIGTKLAKAEQLGADGQVEESLVLMAEVEVLSKEKMKSENELRMSIPLNTYQHQKLRVCEVCSAYLGVHDNDRRLADHFGGKLHLGFIAIREHLEELRNLVKEKETEREKRREKDRERDSMGGGSSSRHKHRHHRSHSREDYHRHRDRSRSRGSGSSRRHRDREHDGHSSRSSSRRDREKDQQRPSR